MMIKNQKLENVSERFTETERGDPLKQNSFAQNSVSGINLNKNESIPNTAAYESATTFEKTNLVNNTSQVRINPLGP